MVSGERAKDLSSAAIQYSQATAAVIDVAIDAAIDADSAAQVRSAPRNPVPEANRAARAQQLEQLDAGLAKTVSLYTSLKHSVNAIKAYFIALQELANGSQADAVGDAVKSVAERVNGVNKALEGAAATPKLSSAQISALGGLAKLVAAQVHGAKVAKALERDAPIIGRALVLQQSVLKLAGDDIRNNLNEANNVFFVDRVRTPYAKGDIGPGWINDRRAYLKLRALGQTSTAVNAAEASAGQMQAVWERILSGAYNAHEITAMLKDTEDLLDAVAALKDANKSK
ncbi:MAG: hypothetical protein HY021_03855 [Burkholderiales bacterium]|nr:hypothetical protein [Burkholderiales bacterium]